MVKHGSGVTRRRAAVAVVAAGAVVVGAPASLAVADHGHGGNNDARTVVSGLNGPRGLSELYHRLVVAEADGTFSSVNLQRSHHGEAELRALGKVPKQFVAPAVDIGPTGTVWVLTPGGPPGTGAATLYKWRSGFKKPRAVANIAAYQQKDPDPYDLEDNPAESNPFGVAALDDGSVLVADAAGNDLLHVSRKGHIETVARLKPRVVKVPKGLPRKVPTPDGEMVKVPKAGTKVKAEAVATSVTVGRDGYWYVGELRGVPGTPGTSEIWRIKPGTTGATCNPAKPNAGRCKRYVDGLTSIMALDASKSSGNLYAVEMSKKSWLKAELKRPGAQIGALIEITGYGKGIRELAPGELTLPGGVAVDERGTVFVAGPVLGKGGEVVAVGGHRDRNHRR